jgi:hypothetical protein
MSSPGAAAEEAAYKPTEGDPLAVLLAQGADALKRQEPPAAEGGPEDPKRAKAGRKSE